MAAALISPAERQAQRAWRLLHVDAPRALALVLRSEAQARQVGDVRGAGWAILVRGFHELYFANPQQAEATLQGVRAQFGFAGDRAGEILAITGHARSLWRQGRAEAALELLLPLRDEGLRLLQHEKRSVMLNAIAGCYSARGDSHTAFAYMQQALRDAGPKRGHGFDAALHCNLSHELIELGDHEEALRHIEIGLQRMEGLTNGRLLTVLRVNRALCLTALGRAVEALDDVRAVAAATPDPSGRGLVFMHPETLALMLLRAGQTAEAAALLARCEAPSLSDDRIDLALAQSLLALQQGGDALAPLRAVEPLLGAAGEERPSLRMRCQHAAALAEVHEAAGNAAEALAALRHWQQLNTERAQRASTARYQAAMLQTELLRVRQHLEEQQARRRAAERLSLQLADANAQLSRRIAEVEALQTRLREQATQDALTGLANRRHLNETLPGVLALALREAAPLAVVLIDLDHFKHINDAHGHPAGDQVLACFGELLRAQLRRSDLAFRYGGEEFCLLLPRTGAADARQKVETLLQRWRQQVLPLPCGAQLQGLSFSAGATDSRTSAPSPGALLNAADQLLLLAKRGGRSRVLTPCLMTTETLPEPAPADEAQAQMAEAQLAEAHARIRLATAAGGIGIWEMDLATRNFRGDDTVAAIYGLTPPLDKLAYRSWTAALLPEDLRIAEEGLAKTLRDGSVMDIAFRVRRPDGALRQVRTRACLRSDAQGRPRSLLGVNWDVTDTQQLQQDLAEQKELLAVTLQSIGDAVITTDAQGRVQWLNPVAERLCAWPRKSAAGQALEAVFCLLDEESREPLALQVGSDAGVAEGLLLARDGREHGVEATVAPIRDADGGLRGGVLVFRDVSEQRRLAQEMRYRASHDALTGLLNRGEFEQRLARSLRGTHAQSFQHALLYIDLDQFKLVNDSCGHSAGDRLLQEVARLFAEGLRTRDTLARLGGDEFALILEHCGTEQAETMAMRIVERIRDYRFLHEGKSFRIGASIGLVTIDKRWAQPEAILQAADRCCYAAKEAGRNRVQVWCEQDDGLAAQRDDMQWTSRIGQALDENRFELFAQRLEPLQGPPQAGLHIELLLRLRERDGSIVSPGAFLPAAERFHLVGSLDRWVLRESLAWLADHTGAVTSLSLNLSGQSVADPSFHAMAIGLLEQTAPAVRERLCLEITETSAITRLGDAAVFVAALHRLGCKVALDDFGAGASSFGYLKRLQVDRLKIDGQFIRRLNEDPLDMVAVASFLQVAQLLGLETVAEFVEKPEVLVALREMGVSYAQGYLLHRPEPLRDLIT